MTDQAQVDPQVEQDALIPDSTKEHFAKSLKQAYEIIMDAINRVHMLNGPERLEIAEAIVEVRTSPMGNEFPIPAAFFIGDISAACNVLQGRLHG